ncbi:hypothetical protein J4474_03610 [Candidatus Pacearchaeota archaeon]|nr:hypothetical protein [Candidatus Pacearchaeota archaeon]
MQIETLKKIGLSEKEAKVYLCLLRLDYATATKISKETEVERSLCYSILQKLIGRGLVSYFYQKKARMFKATGPQKLLEDLKEKESEIQKIMPSLISLTMNKKNPAKAEIYQGIKGIQNIFKDMIKEKKDYLFFCEEEGKFQKVLPIYLEQFLRKIEDEGIKEKILVKRGIKIPKSKNSFVRYLPKDYFSPISTIVYGNKVALVVWSEPYYAFLIENKEVADSFKSYFNLLWKIGKER